MIPYAYSMRGVSAVYGWCMDGVWVVYEECMEECNAKYCVLLCLRLPYMFTPSVIGIAGCYRLQFKYNRLSFFTVDWRRARPAK